MKIVYFTKYARKGASSRLRSYQFQSFFEQKGHVVKYVPFFDDLYLQNFYSNKKNGELRILGYYINRFWQLFKVAKYDLVVIEKELFPYFPAIFERLLVACKIKFIVDFDDAVFHNYDLHPNWCIKKILGKKIKVVMHLSELVVVGNKYLNSYALQARAKRTLLLPTVIELDRYPLRTFQKKEPIVIGWMGSPTSFKYFKVIHNVIRVLQAQHEIHWHVVGAADVEIPSDLKNVSFFDWSEDQEYEALAAFDIGIMPLDDTPWENGKCAYKLIQYMAAGLPVVASAVGMNCDVIRHEINGYIASNDAEWINYLGILISDAQLRENLGKQGRLLIEEQYNTVSNFEKLHQQIIAL